MKDKVPFSIKLIYWLTNIASALFIIVVFGVIIFKVLFHFGVLGGELNLHMDLPTSFALYEAGNIVVEGENYEVLIQEAYGQMSIQNTPRPLVNFVSWTLILIVSIGAYIMWVLRKFVKNVRFGVVFTVENISYIKHFAYGLIAIWFSTLIYQRLLYHYLIKRIEFDNLTLSGEFENHGSLLIAALFIWVLSHIFITGLKMKEDIELTV
jgi:hypothetical protein